MANRIRKVIQTHPLVAYFLLAYGLTWLGSLYYYFTTPAVSNGMPTLRSLPGALVWYYGPCLAALIVTATTLGREGLRHLYRRMVLWRVGWQWYVFIVLYPFALHLAVVWLRWLLGGPTPHFFEAEGVPQANVLLTLLVLFVVQIFLRGIGEETGWRGYALPNLLKRHSAFTASLILGVLWGAWHFHPANFAALLSLGGGLIFLAIVGTTVIYTWVFNHTGGSILIAILFHSTLNLVEYIIPTGMDKAGTTTYLLMIALQWLLIGGVLWKEGKNLVVKPNPSE